MIRLFVVGHPRSGTTLLQSLIAKNWFLYSPPETHFIGSLLYRRSPFKGRYLVEKPNRRRSAYKKLKIINQELCKNYNGSFYTKDHLLTYISILDDQARKNDANGWLEKCPENLYFIDLIKRCLPEIKIFHIVRQPKGNLASLKDASMRYPNAWPKSRYQDLDQLIVDYARAMATHKTSLRKNNNYLISYESLPQQHAFLARLEAILGKPENTLSGYNSDPNTIIKPEEGWKRRNLDSRILIDNDSKARDVFSPQELQKIESRLHPLYDELNES